LLGKELRLQWIVVALIVGMGGTVLSLSQSPPTSFGTEILLYSVMFWAFMICVVAGGVASSEERQMGVVEAQALLPVRRGRQWALKAGLVLAVALLGAGWLPNWLLSGGSRQIELLMPAPKWWCLGAIVVSALSLYISSCCRTTMRAVLVSLPAGGVAVVALAFFYTNEQRLLHSAGADFWPPLTWIPFLLGGASWLSAAVYAPYLLAGLLVGLWLICGSRNHFSADRGRGAPAQVAAMLAWLAIGFIFCLALTIRAGHL
jgi:hypothetical protein